MPKINELAGADALALTQVATFGATGSVATPQTARAKFQEIVSVADFGALGDGTTDDSAAIQAALTATPAGAVLRFPAAGKTYLAGNLVNSTGCIVDLNGATLKAKPGADWVVKMTGWGGWLRNGTVTDPTLTTLRTTTLSAGALSSATSVQVANATAFAAGRLIAVKLDSGRWHLTKVSTVVGTTVSFLDALPGAAANNNQVMTARGLVICDGSGNGRVAEIFFPAAPVCVEITSTTYTHDMTFEKLRGYSVVVCGIFLDVHAAVCNFRDITFYGHDTTISSGFGVVGIYQEGRVVGVLPTGGHTFDNVNCLTFERGWQLREAQLTNYINCIGDTCQHEAWYIGPCTNFGVLTFSKMFAAASDKGVVFETSYVVHIDGLYTNNNTTSDLEVAASSRIWIDESTWGPSRVVAGAGNINWFLSEIFGGLPGKHALELRALEDAVNHIKVWANITGFAPLITTEGSDTNIPLYHITKGSGGHFFQGNGSSAPKTWFAISGDSAAVNYPQAVGSATGQPVQLTVSGSDTNVDMFVLTKGTGKYRINLSGLLNCADDAAAATASVPVGGVYRNGSVLMVRVT